MLSGRFSFFSGGDSNSVNNSSKVEQKNQEQRQQGNLLPSIKLVADKDVYKPGDPVVITIEICNPSKGTNLDDMCYSLLVERLSFEVKGIEKLDTQWFATQKPFPGSKQRRGEHVFLDSSAPTVFSKQIISAGTTKSYIVRTTLPSVIPPSYKGSTIRYLYYAKSILSGRWLILENGHSQRDSVKDLTGLEGRIPLQVWVDRKSSGLETEGLSDEIVPSTTIQMDVFWKEMDGESDWVRAINNFDGIEDDYESSKDEISSVSSFNLTRGNLHRTFSSSLSLQSPKSSNRDSTYLEGGRPSLSSRMAFPQLSVAEELYDYGAGHERKLRKSFSSHNDPGISTSPGAGAVESAASEGFIHGRSYNIRLDKQVLLKFSPRNSDSTYYFSDTIGGTLTFFHEEGAQRCLEVSITLETSETVSRRHVHPSRKNSPTITKVQSDHYEVVADLLQTSFLFSIPMDGPMSFSTPHVSVQWVLRFEFFTTPKNVDWTRYEHPLLIEGREKCEWILPITVHAPPPGASVVRNTKEKPLPLDPMWVQN